MGPFPTSRRGTGRGLEVQATDPICETEQGKLELLPHFKFVNDVNGHAMYRDELITLTIGDSFNDLAKQLPCVTVSEMSCVAAMTRRGVFVSAEMLPAIIGKPISSADGVNLFADRIRAVCRRDGREN